MNILSLTKARLILPVAAAISALCCGVPLSQAEENAKREAVATGQELGRVAEKKSASEEAEEKTELPALDSSRQGVRQATEWVARGVDSWFGDIPFEEGGKVTWMYESKAIIAYLDERFASA